MIVVLQATVDYLANVHPQTAEDIKDKLISQQTPKGNKYYIIEN